MQGPISYEKLFEFLREERNNQQLQTLPDSFYSDVISYLDMKDKALESLKENNSLTYDNAKTQLKNAKNIIEDIYNRREKKILSLAMTKSKTKSQLVDTSPLLYDEKVFYEEITTILDKYRVSILDCLFSKKMPEHSEKNSNSPKIEKKDDKKQEIKQEEPVESAEIAIKILKYVDKFVGPELDIIGPFEQGITLKLPSEVANLLIKKEFAEKI